MFSPLRPKCSFQYCFAQVASQLDEILVWNHQLHTVLDWIVSYPKFTEGCHWWPWIWPLDQGCAPGVSPWANSVTLFTSPLGDLCRSHGILDHGYADDTQKYHAFSPNTPGNVESCIITLKHCIDDIRIWMRTSFLKLNSDNMKFLIMETLQQLAKVNTTSIKISQDNIQKSETARNLGIYYDLHMKNTSHVNKLCSTLYLTLKKISKIRHTIDMDMTRILVQALVTLKLDYYNGLMLGSTKYNIAKLQRIQTSAAHIVYMKTYVLHSRPYLKSLHWLKIEERITYKIAVLMFRCINISAPKYFQDLVIRNHTRTLRSSLQLKLPVVKCNLSQVHKSNFTSIEPRIWNCLSYGLKIIDSINDFKGKLKTHLFAIS